MSFQIIRVNFGQDGMDVLSAVISAIGLGCRKEMFEDTLREKCDDHGISCHRNLQVTMWEVYITNPVMPEADGEGPRAHMTRNYSRFFGHEVRAA